MTPGVKILPFVSQILISNMATRCTFTVILWFNFWINAFFSHKNQSFVNLNPLSKRFSFNMWLWCLSQVHIYHIYNFTLTYTSCIFSKRNHVFWLSAFPLTCNFDSKYGRSRCIFTIIFRFHCCIIILYLSALGSKVTLDGHLLDHKVATIRS